MLPLPAEPEALVALVWHERWHCLQQALGLPSREADNGHLAAEAGRTWLRLELRALARALASHDESQARLAAAAALAFRAQRSDEGQLGTGALRQEASLERNEGLAEYTGRTVAARDPVPDLLEALQAADGSTSFVRSSAYVTGPAYGLLLDRWASGWRASRTPDLDLPSLLDHALAGKTPHPNPEQAGAAYGLAAVRSEEAARAAEHRRKAKILRGRFLAADALRLPLRSPSVAFDPRTLFPLDEHGTVYSPITVRDVWGELVASDGALLAADWSLVSVGAGGSQGCGMRWRGNGWTLKLAEGWRMKTDATGTWLLSQGDPIPCAESGN